MYFWQLDFCVTNACEKRKGKKTFMLNSGMFVKHEGQEIWTSLTD